MIEDAGSVVDADALTGTLDRALDGDRPPREPTDRAPTCDLDNVTSQRDRPSIRTEQRIDGVDVEPYSLHRVFVAFPGKRDAVSGTVGCQQRPVS